MPVAIGFHPYFQLTDSTRDDWTLAIRAKTHWLLSASTIPTGETQPITALFPDAHTCRSRTFRHWTTCSRISSGTPRGATMTLKGKQQELDVMVGPNFKAMLVLTRTGGGRGAQTAAPPRGSVAFEPMAGISNSMNLAQKGLYKELQSIPAGGTWEESFWLRPRGF